jgi:pseudouridine-5'-phosphate glycosidase
MPLLTTAVVALESTIVAHGMPLSENLNLSQKWMLFYAKCQTATIAVREGHIE